MTNIFVCLFYGSSVENHLKNGFLFIFNLGQSNKSNTLQKLFKKNIYAPTNHLIGTLLIVFKKTGGPCII